MGNLIKMYFKIIFSVVILVNGVAGDGYCQTDSDCSWNLI